MKDNTPVEYFKHNGQLIGMCVRGSHSWDKTEFLTDDDNYQQVGLLYYEEGHDVKPHAHYKVPRTVHFTQEVLFCVSGRIVYTFYDADHDWAEITSCELHPNDMLCLFGAGHGAKALEPTRLIEIKQGPFLGAKDKFYYPDKPEAVE
ncbi:MAG: hypothetical protein JW969_01470 [Spirochaetales bacterium]|nr:hypothetical protein [Spirochaetales bacterium]